MDPDALRPSRRRLRRFALVALATNILIVVTGGIVRVTGSGLGCPRWPTCDGTNIAPSGALDHDGWRSAVEFGNRLLTFVVLAAAVAVFLEMRRTRPHHRSVETLAWILPAGVLCQALLGGITVLTGLSPVTVAAHFLLSMVLIAAAAALYEWLAPRAPDATTASTGIRRGTNALAFVAFVVLVLGTIVTGAGPHGGDVGAARFGVDIRFAAIAHADAVWLLVGLTTALVVVSWHVAPGRTHSALRALLALELAQGGIGYLQYALGIPPELVSLHILGATLVWTAAVVAWARCHPLALDRHGSPSAIGGPMVRTATNRSS